VVLFNYSLKELTAKIVYYGPGLSGKTTNLQYIYDELPLQNKGRLLTLATETDRTLYFDFLPLEAGIFRGIKTRVQVYTVPGQVFYNTTRRMVLKGADGVVFVADSQRTMLEANMESIANLRENLLAHDLRIEEIPLVMQYNKRDLPEVLSVEEMNEKVNTLNVPFYETVATGGIGVEDTLKAISGLVLRSVLEKYGAKPGPALPAAQPAASVAVAGGGASAGNRWQVKESTDPFSTSEPGGNANVDSGSSPVDPFTGAPKAEVTSPELRRKAITQPSARRGNAESPGEIFKELDIEEVLDGALSGENVPPSPEPASPLGDAWGKKKDSDGRQETNPAEENEISLLVHELGSGQEGLPLRNGVTTEPGVPTNPEIGFHELDLEGQAFVDLSQPASKAPAVEIRIEASPGVEGKPQRVVIPVRLSIDPDAKEVEFNLVLHIRVERKPS
jgi:signal recognition particle receptor subunit beta